MKKVLITGMSGLIGGILKAQWEDKYQLSALNRRPIPGVECHQADVSDLDAIQPAFNGKDVVVHLAAIADFKAPWEEVLKHNVIGTYNVFEAARRAGVKRVIYGSSGQVFWGWEREIPYNAILAGRYEDVPSDWRKLPSDARPRPANLYGCSKVWGEALASSYADAYDMSMICVRIFHVTSENRPILKRDISTWCSHRDIGQLFDKCLGLPDEVRFEILQGVSRNKWFHFDTAGTREKTGFEPLDSSDQYIAAKDDLIG